MVPDYTAEIRSLTGLLDEPLPPFPEYRSSTTAESHTEAAQGDTPCTLARSPFIEWPPFWERRSTGAEWVVENVLAKGRAHVIFGPRKMFKSLLTLDLCARMATGPGRVVVVYLDYENTDADVRERLEDMGYGPESDLSRLLYWQLPCLPPLDSPAGAEELMGVLDDVQAAHPGHHLVVVLDTFSRAVAGEENDSSTVRAFYSNTGIQMKRRGITQVRLDHSGKDVDKGQRGSSAKGDDVDVVWRITATDNGVRLHRDAARMAWVPDNVAFRITDDPLSFVQHEGDWPTGTREVANILDRLSVPLDASTRTAQQALKAVDEGRRRELVGAALKWRRKQAADCFRAPQMDGNHLGNHPGEHGPGTTPGTTPADTDSEAGTTLGTTRNH